MFNKKGKVKQIKDIGSAGGWEHKQGWVAILDVKVGLTEVMSEQRFKR